MNLTLVRGSVNRANCTSFSFSLSSLLMKSAADTATSLSMRDSWNSSRLLSRSFPFSSDFLLAGFLGRLIDEVLMRFTDMMLVIPGLPLLIVLVAVLRASIWNLIIVIGFLGWMGFARIVRSQVLTLRERPIVEASMATGASPCRIIT